MRLVTTIAQVMLGVAFLGAGGQKLARSDQQVEAFVRYGYPQWFMRLTGMIEIGGALGMLLGFFRPILVPIAACLLVTTMIGALATHIRLKDSVQKMLPPALLLTFASGVLGRYVISRRVGRE